MLTGSRMNTWKSRRIGWVGLAAALVALALWLAHGPLGDMLLARDEIWARIQRDRVFRVGMDASYPPFEVVNEAGQFVGYDVDLARALAERWGCRAEFASVSFDGLYDALRTDKFDLLISALPYDRTLTRDVLYSQSYFNAGEVLVARSDDIALSTLADLGDDAISVELGSEAHQLARQLVRDQGLSFTILPQREPEQVVEAVRQGRARALICDRVTANGYLGQADDLRLVGAPLTDAPYVIAVRLDAPQLLAEINTALAETRDNGFFDDLDRRWFSTISH